MAQVSIDETELSAAITSLTAQSASVVSATGAAVGNLLVVISGAGAEAMEIRRSYDGSSTTIPVTRGVAGTRALLHDASAKVFIGAKREFKTSNPTGGYGATGDVYALPWVNLLTGEVWDLDSGNNWYKLEFGARITTQTVTPTSSDTVGVNVVRPGVSTVIVGANVNDTDDYLVLPSLADVPDGHTITVFCNNAGHEIRTPASSAEEINSEDCDGTKEYTVPSGREVHIFYKINSTIGWMGAGWTAIGAKTTAVVPDA